MEASFTQGHILQIGPPSPPPVGTLLCQLDCDNKRHPLPRLPSPTKRRSGGWGGGVPRGPRGPRNLTYRRQRPRPELRAGAAAAAAAGSAWCDAGSSPLLSGPATSHRRPPQLGGPPFSSFPPPLFLSYPSATRTRGVGEEAELGAPCGGSADEGTPPDPKSKPFAPCFSLRSSFPRPWAKLTAPSPSRLRLQKCTIGRRRGGGVGAWTGWGSPWKGPDGALGAPLVSASSVHGPGARTTVPPTEVPRGGLRGREGGEGWRREGEEGRGKKKKGGGRATRQSGGCACAGLARCPGEGESGQLRGLALRPAVRDRGPVAPLAGSGRGASCPPPGPFSPPLRVAGGTGVLGQWARQVEWLLP